jgi:hypothetical protein
MKLKKSYYTFVSCIRVTKGEDPKDATKDRTEFTEANILAKAYNSTSQEYSPRPRGENLLQHSTPVMGSNTKSSTQSLNFPLRVINSITRRERRRNLHTTEIQ